MKNSRFIKMLSMIIAVVMIIASLPFAVGAVGNNMISIEKMQYSMRLMSVISVKINELKALDNVAELTVSTIKDASDLAGNEYKIVECSPSGYLIFNEATGVFTEYSSSAPSPYLECNNQNLVYCGPTFYYVEDNGGNLHHVINTSEEIESHKRSSYKESCAEYFDSLEAGANQLVVDYLDGEYQNQSFLQVATNVAKEHISRMATTYGYLENYEFFFDMEECGYYSPSGSDGICGYIALGMLIAYKEKYNSSSNYMDDIFWNDAAHNNLKPGVDSIAWHLRSNHGSKDGTYSTTIKAVSESYFSGRGVTVNHVSKWWGFFNDGTIMDSIDNDNPVIIFGSLFNPKNKNDNINHAVVAYKYTDHSGLFGETNFTTHYGWNGYENIYVSGTFGSIYILE